MAKSRVDKAYQGEQLPFDYYMLDLLSYRNVSNYIAEKLGVTHQSPQAIVVSNGVSVYDASHLDINPSSMAGIRI